MNDFKTTQEIWEHLIAGGKVVSITIMNPCRGAYVVFLRDGKPSLLGGPWYGGDFLNPEDWSKYQEPKKLVPHWPAVIKDGQGSLILTSSLHTETNPPKGVGFIKLAKEYPAIELEAE